MVVEERDERGYVSDVVESCVPINSPVLFFVMVHIASFAGSPAVVNTLIFTKILGGEITGVLNVIL